MTWLEIIIRSASYESFAAQISVFCRACDSGVVAVRGLKIGTGQYSSLSVSAVVLTLGSDNIEEVDVQVREQADSER